jgi:hypothetical protein
VTVPENSNFWSYKQACVIYALWTQCYGGNNSCLLCRFYDHNPVTGQRIRGQLPWPSLWTQRYRAKRRVQTQHAAVVLCSQTYDTELFKEAISVTWVRRVAQSVKCLATDWTTGLSRFDLWQRRKDGFPLAFVFRPALGPTQTPVQWVPGVISPGLKRGRGVTLTTHHHLVPSSRMKSYTSSPLKRLRDV